MKIINQINTAVIASFLLIINTVPSICLAASASVTGSYTSGNETYFCAGSVTATATPSTPAPTPTSPTCCSTTGAPNGSWTLTDTRYQFNLNGNGVQNSTSNSNTVDLPPGPNTYNGEVQYEFTCEDGSLGYSTEPFSMISNKTAYTDDETTTPNPPAPNPNPNYTLPDKTGDIYFASTSDTLSMYDHYFSGTFENIKGSDTFVALNGGNDTGHTNCGETGKTLSFPGVSSSVGISVGMSASRSGVGVSGNGTMSVTIGSTGTGQGGFGANHKMVFWQVYKRETQITAFNAKSGAYHKVINRTLGGTTNEGSITTNTNLPTSKQDTGRVVKTDEIDCCPNT